jgi:rubredoxin
MEFMMLPKRWTTRNNHSSIDAVVPSAAESHVLAAINIFNRAHLGLGRMSLEMDHECPSCGEVRPFWLTASTKLHLGEKTKWVCPECEYGLVLIDDIDSSA